MGTRSTTSFYKKANYNQEHCLATMYRQFDGYLSGHGSELKEYLKGKKVTNGISIDNNWNNSFNGMGCLAASVIHHFKKDIGGIYLFPENSKQEYNYRITCDDDGFILVKIEAYGEIIYDGKIDDLETEKEGEE